MNCNCNRGSCNTGCVGGAVWLVPVTTVPPVQLANRRNAYILPDDSVWVLNHEGNEVVPLFGSGCAVLWANEGLPPVEEARPCTIYMQDNAGYVLSEDRCEWIPIGGGGSCEDCVLTVNGQDPDSDGNVEITIPEVFVPWIETGFAPATIREEGWPDNNRIDWTILHISPTIVSVNITYTGTWYVGGGAANDVLINSTYFPEAEQLFNYTTQYDGVPMYNSMYRTQGSNVDQVTLSIQSDGSLGAAIGSTGGNQDIGVTLTNILIEIEED